MSRKQQQFLEVLDRDEAEARWREVVVGAALPSEEIALADALPATARAIRPTGSSMTRSALREPIPFTVVKSSKNARSVGLARPIRRGRKLVPWAVPSSRWMVWRFTT